MRHLLRSALTSWLVLAALGSSQENTHNSKIVWEPTSIEWPATGAGGSVIHGLSVSGFRIVLDETALKDAKRKLGGVIGSRGDAGDWEAWLCYQGSDQMGPWVFWLTSAEINGDAIGGFTWKRLEAGEAIDSRCAALRGPDPINLQLPLYLGMKQAQAEGVLGEPTSVLHSELFYMHSHKQTIKAVRYTIDNGVEIDSRAAAVVQISAFETSSD